MGGYVGSEKLEEKKNLKHIPLAPYEFYDKA